MKINRSPRPAAYVALADIAKAMDETNDCAVKAVALVADISYEAALALCEQHGRKKGDGLETRLVLRAVRAAGCAATRMDPRSIIEQYPGSHKLCKNITTHHPERFNKVWKNGKTYLMFVRGHCLAIKDGENLDWSKGRAKRAIGLYEVTRPSSK